MQSEVSGPAWLRSALGAMSVVFGALCLLAVAAWLSYVYPKSQVWLLRVLGLIVVLIALGVAAWFAVSVYRTGAIFRDENRRNSAATVGKELAATMNSTNLDGITKEFTADLASIRGRYPWVDLDRPRREDRRGCVRVILTNDLGQALVMLLQDKGWRGGVRFRLLSYEKITQPVAAPNGGPTMSVGDSGASGGRHR